MRLMICLGAAVAALTTAGCSSTPEYASACERDYAQNRAQATAAGALIGGAAGAAIDDDNDARGAAIGAALGGLVGNQLARQDDPCGYGFGGYARDDRYGYYDRDGIWRPR